MQKKMVAVLVVGLLTGPAFFGQLSDGSKESLNWIDRNNNDIVDPYEDPSLPIEERVEDLLSRMTLEEKIQQMSGIITDPYSTPDNTRLGIPGFRFADGPHGVRFGSATSFPVSMAMGSTWDPDLVERIAVAIGKEARAKGRNVFLAPCISIVMDPRGGRSQESYGEDPYILSRMGVSFVNGIQSQDVVAMAKHFACNNIENTRFICDVQIDERTLREVYLPHFKACVQEANVGAIMSAYNRVRGQYCSANRHLLTTILREEWGFEGFVVSDWGAFGSPVGSANAGLNVEMPFPLYYNVPFMVLSVKLGLISEKTIDELVKQMLTMKFLFGFFDGWEPFSEDIVECKEHTDLAREAEQKAIVLLKNNDLLPLDIDKLDSIAVIGPAADEARLGDKGSSQVLPSYAITPLQGVKNKVGDEVDVYYSDGSNFDEAKALAEKSDMVIIVVGLSHKDEGEYIFIKGGDRDDLDLPGGQSDLINEIASVNKNTTVVLIGGSAIAMDEWMENVQAILMAWYPGQEGGNAIADVVFGDCNPSGKLPITFPKSVDQLPPFPTSIIGSLFHKIDYRYYQGYRHFDKYGLEPLFPFGYGLSYTEFEYSGLKISREKFGIDDTVEISVDVKNIGDREGEDVVQLYVSDVIASVDMPSKELRGFKRVSLKPGETKTIQFELEIEKLAYYDVDANSWVVEPGEFIVYVAKDSQDLVLEDSFEVTMELPEVRDLEAITSV